MDRDLSTIKVLTASNSLKYYQHIEEAFENKLHFHYFRKIEKKNLADLIARIHKIYLKPTNLLPDLPAASEEEKIAAADIPKKFRFIILEAKGLKGKVITVLT